MSNPCKEYSEGDIVEVWFGGDTWIRGAVRGPVESYSSRIAITFRDGTFDYPSRKLVRRVTPLKLLAEQSE